MVLSLRLALIFLILALLAPCNRIIQHMLQQVFNDYLACSLIVKDVAIDPNFLAYKFDFDSECVEFIPISNQQLREVSFLRRNVFADNLQTVMVPIAELMELVTKSKNLLVDHAPSFIFHTAFCSSTFMSRCLDIQGKTVCLREPQILLDAANAKRLNWRSRDGKTDYRHLIKLSLALLLKHRQERDGSASRLIIKPINSVNNIVPEILESSPQSRALMMYTDIRNFMLSTLNKREAGTRTVRAMFDLVRCDFPHLAKLSISNAVHMTDLKMILTLWRLQIQQAAGVMQHMEGKKSIASLHAETLIENPAISLQSANRFLQLNLSEGQIKEVVQSDGMYRDAKDQTQRFSVAGRLQKYQVIEEYFGEDIENALKWMRRSNPAVSLDPRLSSPLQ
jgi:hypothetical protein